MKKIEGLKLCKTAFRQFAGTLAFGHVTTQSVSVREIESGITPTGTRCRPIDEISEFDLTPKAAGYLVVR